MIFKDFPFKANANEYQVLYEKICNSEPDYPSNHRDILAIDLLQRILEKQF